jgi:hypothetical protein
VLLCVQEDDTERLTIQKPHLGTKLRDGDGAIDY